MGVVEDPLVLKTFMGMLSKKKQFLPGKGMWVEGMIASYSILELNQIKSKQSSSYTNMPVALLRF